LEVPPIRLEVRSDADTVTSIRYEHKWPPPATDWIRWWFHPDGRLDESKPTTGKQSFRMRGHGLHYSHRFDADTEIIGPMSTRLSISLPNGGDVCLFVGVRKVRNGRIVAFEGAYGFRGGMVTHGIRKASLHIAGLDGQPRDDIAQFLAPNQIVPVDIELMPSATLFRPGEELQVVVSGRWFYARNPFTGQFPAYYEKSPRGLCNIHLGSAESGYLDVPVQAVPS